MIQIRPTDQTLKDIETIRQALKDSGKKATITEAVKIALATVARGIREGQPLDPSGPPPSFVTRDELEDMERRIRERRMALDRDELEKMPTPILEEKIDELMARKDSGDLDDVQGLELANLVLQHTYRRMRKGGDQS